MVGDFRDINATTVPMLHDIHLVGTSTGKHHYLNGVRQTPRVKEALASEKISPLETDILSPTDYPVASFPIAGLSPDSIFATLQNTIS